MRSLPFFLLFSLPFFTNAQTWVAKEQALADIDFMNKTIEEVHYNPWFFVSREVYQKKTDSLKRTLPDSIELKTFTRKLYSLTATLDDGHTAPSFVQNVLRPEFGKKQFAPFYFVTDEKDQVYLINPNSSGIKTTDRILSINQIDLTSFAKEIHQFYGGTGPFKKEMADRLFSWHLFLAGVKPPFHIRYQQAAAIKEAVIDSAVSFRNALMITLPNVAGKTFSFTTIGDKIGYMDFISMSVRREVFEPFVDSCMRVLRDKKIPVLVIDLRNNSGGNSAMADLLISRFYSKEYNLMGYRYWKISQQYKDYINRNGGGNEMYLNQENGTTWKRGNCEKRKAPFKYDSLYTGKVYLITGPFTFSSANMFADGAKQYHFATVIGEATGENTNDFGETLSFELPNSKIGITVTTSYDIGADCNDKIVTPVIPDIFIKTSTEQRLKGEDPVMQYIIKMEKN